MHPKCLSCNAFFYQPYVLLDTSVCLILTACRARVWSTIQLVIEPAASRRPLLVDQKLAILSPSQAPPRRALGYDPSALLPLRYLPGLAASTASGVPLAGDSRPVAATAGRSTHRCNSGTGHRSLLRPLATRQRSHPSLQPLRSVQAHLDK